MWFLEIIAILIGEILPIDFKTRKKRKKRDKKKSTTKS